MVVDTAAVVVERPYSVLVPLSRVGAGDDAEGRPVPNRRVGMLQIRLDPHHGLTLLVGPVQHLPPSLQVYFRRLIPAWAYLLRHVQLLEDRGVAGADVGGSHLHELHGVAVVDLQPVRLHVDLVDLDLEPFDVLHDPVVDLKDGDFDVGRGVLVPQDEPAIVHLGIFVAEDDGLSAPQVEGSVGVGGEPGPDLFKPLDVLKGRERLLLLFLPFRLEELGPSVLYHLRLAFEGP